MVVVVGVGAIVLADPPVRLVPYQFNIPPDTGVAAKGLAIAFWQ